ncbi:MAG: undecaprenyl/decaprenyl-phosphate alpha-N-acetylglucosaminyl 1-phosphate transferase [Actinomycetota bacterium]|jgi:UDP-GlcNAc:undecaprenyl-phosphate GlcNAc-1-phosphate transferase|nr:undecaprenyl/decaprenyl-phosphate alpha-N-acetylglucosaminyl 1-phosphate transferase [Actinomycetota bacterium]
MSFLDALRALVGDAAVVWGLPVAAVLVLVLTPLVGRLAPRVGGLDDSADRPRVHAKPVPRIGGLAIVAGILVPAAIFVDLSGTYTGIMLGTLCVAALGLVDDLHGLRPSVKLAGVALVALVPVVGYELSIDHVTLPLIGDHDLGWVGYPIAVVWITGVANLVNLIDGMDALAAGIVAIAAAAFALLAASFGRMEAAALAAIVCGATLGFLRHNYHPAKIFMGDSGALALGFVLAALALDGLFKTTAAITLVAPMLVLAVPILDTSFVVLKRLKYRRPPWGADHNHFYHRFLRIGLSQRRTAAYLHVWAGLLAAYAIFARFFPPRPEGSWDLERTVILAGTGLVVIGVSVWMVYSLEILKRRHLELVRLRRRPDPEEDEPEAAVERVLSAGRR